MRTLLIEKHLQTAVRPSPRVLEVAAMFGLGVDESRELAVVPRCEIPLPHLNGRSGIVFVTGPSGSGKSTILKLIADALRAPALSDVDDCPVLQFDDLPPPADAPLVDVFADVPLDRALMVLSVAGLNEAFVMLRGPMELSDGQRYRLRLAQVMAMLMTRGDPAERAAQDSRQNPARGSSAAVVIADEFGSTLDRVTAQTVSRNLRRWLNKHAPMPVSFICATTHDDLLEALEPDVLVWKGLGEEVEVVMR